MTKLDGTSIAEQLQQIVGVSHFSSDALAAYALDGLTPRWLVSPGSAAEAASIISLANCEKLAVLPRGNGTKFALGGIPRAEDLVLSLGRLNRVVDYDAPNLTVTVEAGVTLGELRRVLASQGNFLPLDAPFDNSTIGGIVATNQTGPKRLAYGSARDLVLGVKAVLPNGEVLRFGGKVVKNVAGYDMTKLLIGSWGTLGVITEMTFRLLPLPESEKSLLAVFPSLEKAARAASAILASQLLPSALELVSPAGFRLVEPKAVISGPGDGYVLAIDLEGFHEAVEREIVDLTALSQREGAKEVRTVVGDEQEQLWTALRDFSRGALANDDSSVGLKITVPISQTQPLFGLAERKAADCGLGCAVIAHAGNGVLYPFFFGSAGKMPLLVQVIHDVQYDAERAGGEAMVEWAPPEVKKRVAVWGEPQPTWSLMRRLKAGLDPNGILNPGRFVGGI
jgi:glycolate dehydrogenase FAD-binding subunit